MAGKALIVEILGDARQFGAELDKAAGKTRQFSKAAGVAGLAIAGGLAFGLEKSVEAASASSVAQARLSTAFRQSGESSKVYAKAIDEAEAAGRNLGFSNIDTKNALGSLEIATHSGTKAIKDLTVAQDIARFKGIGLTDASKMLTMAMAGSQRAVKALGLSLPAVTAAQDKVNAEFKKHSGEAYKAALATAKLTDKQSTAAKVIELVSKKLHGQADAFSQTAAGGAARFHAQMEALQENLGKALLPALEKITSWLADATGWLAQHTTVAKILVGVVATLAAGLMALSVAAKVSAIYTQLFAAAEGEASVASGVLAAAMDAIPIVALVTAFAIAAYEIYSHWSAVSAFFVGLWNDIKAVFSVAIDWVEGHWKIFLGLPGLIWQYWGPITGLFKGMWDTIKGVFWDGVSWIETQMTNAWNWLKTKALEAVLAIVEPFSHLPGFLGGWARKAKDAVQSQLDAINTSEAQRQVKALGDKLGLIAGKQYNVKIAVSAPNVIGVQGTVGAPVKPGHAVGGIFRQPHLAMIAERGPEAVIPLKNGMVAGGSALRSLGGGDSGPSVVVNVGPVHGNPDASFARTLAEEIATQLRGGRVPALQQAIQGIG